MAQFLGEGASWTEWHFALHGDGTDLSGARETWPKGEVGGGEVAGRWSEETASFLRQLARARARSEPPVLQKRAEQAWRLRWGCWHVQQHVLSLVHSGEERVSGGVDGDTPSVHEVLGECRFAGLEAA